MPDLWQSFEWAIWGVYQYARYVIPLIRPDPVPNTVPVTWWLVNTFGDWFWHRDSDLIPDEHWIRRWIWMAVKCIVWAALGDAQELVDKAKSAVLSVIGSVKAGFPSMGVWVSFLQIAIGNHIPFWTADLASGLDWLWDRLPSGIRERWQSWDQLWDMILDRAKSWVRSTYDRIVDKGRNAWDWAQQSGERLKRWVDSVQSWVNRFKSDPYGTIASYLGQTWQWLRGFSQSGRSQVLSWLGPDIGKLLTFGASCATFYYNLWSLGWSELESFVRDPKAFIIDRLTRAIENRW